MAGRGELANREALNDCRTCDAKVKVEESKLSGTQRRVYTLLNQLLIPDDCEQPKKYVSVLPPLTGLTPSEGERKDELRVPIVSCHD